MKKILITAVAGLVGVMTVSATLLVDVDGVNGQSLSGSQVTFEANEGGGAMPNVGDRFKSVTLSGTDRTAITGTLTTKIDYYLHWNNITGAVMNASSYKYAKIDYSLEGDWFAGLHKIRLGDTVTATGSSGVADNPSNPELLNTALANGAHSFIIDLTADLSYAGDWAYFRWNFYNSADNTSSVDESNEQKLTIDKITFATDIIPEPATFSMLAVCGGAVLFLRRRFFRI